MRINRYIAQATGLSRRTVDVLIAKGLVQVNGLSTNHGQDITDDDDVTLEGRTVPKIATVAPITIMLNKPTGYVTSREGQGSKTVYDLLPSQYHELKPVGRLDKDSSGLLLMTNDGKLANELTHPSFEKEKVYEVRLNQALKPDDFSALKTGVELEDGLSHLEVQPMGSGPKYEVRMKEGRNRQIRRTFSALNYTVKKLHRTQFGTYKINNLSPGMFEKINVG